MEFSFKADDKKQFLILQNYINEIRNHCPNLKESTDGQIIHCALMSFQKENKVPHKSICNTIPD